MKDKLLSYLLDDLNPAERAEVEAALASDPALRDELAKLQVCMGSCEEEEQPAPTPSHLAKRTCSFVDHAIQKSKCLSHASGAAIPGSRLSENRDPCCRRKKWTAVDWTILAGIILMLGSLTSTSLFAKREESHLIACQNNLHQVGAGLMNYTYNFRKGLPKIEPGEHAGAYVMTLADNKIFERNELARILVCPSSELAERIANGCVVVVIPPRKKFNMVSGADRERLCRFMGGSFAYPIGFQNEAGELEQVDFSGSRYVPLLADAPSKAIAGYQSANHGGCGQNVIFQDLSCKFTTQCKCQAKKDHWFVNDAGKVAAGQHSNDLVLGASEATPLILTITVKK